MRTHGILLVAIQTPWTLANRFGIPNWYVHPLSPQNGWSLSELYRQLPSPSRPTYIDPSLLHPPHLQCTLYDYQKTSLAKLLQRELQPESYADPYYVQCTSPCTLSRNERLYLFDPERCLFHRRYQVALYPDLKGGILCDEMGVGKTIICLALILATLDDMSEPDLEPMASTITSQMALTFPDHEYQGADPSGLHSRRLVTAAFGAPSPGERMGRHPKPPPISDEPRMEPTAETIACSPVSLVSIAAHKLRTTHACRPALTCTLPPQIQEILDERSAPFFHLWPPPPARVSRISQSRSPLRVYITSATLVLVPLTLLTQWMSEIKKHCEPGALRVFTLSDMHTPLPPASVLAQNYDIVLLSHARFGHEAGDEQGMKSDLDKSPLMQVYWKRLIIDEGNVLAGDSLVVRLCTRLRVERRWIVTGTPTYALVGASACYAAGKDLDNNTESRHEPKWTPSERKNLDRLKQLLVRFLRITPFCGTHSSMASAAKASGLAPAKERDWNALMASEWNAQEQGEWPAKRRLFDVLSRVMVRNRAEDVEKERPLPPLQRRVQRLTPSATERTTYNVLQSLILLNAALTQEKDKDYFFHPNNKKALATVMENLALACFHFAGQGLYEQAQSAYEHIEQQLSLPNGVAAPYRSQAEEAHKQLQQALALDTWRQHILDRDVMYTLEHVPETVLHAWSAHNRITLTSDELVRFRQACIATTEEFSDADDVRDELITKGMQFRHRHANRARGDPKTPNPRKNTRLHEGSLPLVRSFTAARWPTEWDPVIVQSSSSTKLNAILLELLEAVPHEKVLVFSVLDNVLFELASALDLLQIPYLLYVSGMPQHLRNTYAEAFTQKSTYRCLLMTTTVGGRGLDLHCASRVILAEPVWQQDLESQAVKRAWRMGQTRSVTVTTYIMKHTFEEQLITRKQTYGHDAALDQTKSLTDDPGMRDFVAHPHFIPEDDPPPVVSWNVPLFALSVHQAYEHAGPPAKRPRTEDTITGLSTREEAQDVCASMPTKSERD